jgi:mRNA interferase HigB
VFNVGGNKYRLVIEVQYQAAIVCVKFIGTQAHYDRIDVETVNDYGARPQTASQPADGQAPARRAEDSV